MPDQVVQHWEEWGYKNTPTARSACLMECVAEGVKMEDGSAQLHCSIITTNYAVLDNCRGGCKVGLLDNGNEVASYIIESPRNPARGFAPPTQRSGIRSDTLPTNIKFNQVAFKFANLDNGDDYTVPWDKVIDIGIKLLGTLIAA